MCGKKFWLGLVAGLGLALSAWGQAPPAPYRGPRPSGDLGAITSGPFSARADEEGRVTFSSFSDLVLVPVIVTDKSGAHVHGLKQDDFTLTEDGRKQKIATFEEIVPAAGLPARPSVPANTFTNALPAGASPPRLTIIAIDTVNTSFLDQATARRQVLKYLAQSLQPGGLVALMSLDRSGVHVLHDFTADTGSLIAALRRVTGELPLQPEPANPADLGPPGNQPVSPPTGIAPRTNVATLSQLEDFLTRQSEASYQASQLDAALEVTLKNFLSLAQAFRGVPGRKSLVWVTASFPVYVDDPSYIPGRRLGPLYERAFQAVSDANIAVYPLDARGLVTLFPSGETRLSSSQLGGEGFLNVMSARLVTHQDSIYTLQQIADMTGGRAFYDRNDLAAALQQVDSDSASYYVVGYYLDHHNTHSGWRQLKVKVDRGDTRVRARAGLYVTPATANPEITRALDVLTALQSPLDDTALSLAVRWTNVAAEGAKKKVHFVIALPASQIAVDEGHQNQVSLDFAGEAKTPQALVAAHFGRNLQGHIDPAKLAQFRSVDFTYEGDLELAPGEYLVRFAVRDNLSGKLGSVSAPLTLR